MNFERFAAAAPDILWVRMTAPKQEKWLHQHHAKVTGERRKTPSWVVTPFCYTAVSIP